MCLSQYFQILRFLGIFSSMNNFIYVKRINTLSKENELVSKSEIVSKEESGGNTWRKT